MWQRHLIKPKQNFELSCIDANEPKTFENGKEKAEVRLGELRGRLAHLQELLYAEAKHKFLIIMQAMDTGGKDGTIRYVFSGVNPQGVNVVRFQAPTPEELSHDFLWRIHKNTPEKGKIVIFNRSHYEDVVTVKVHNLVPKDKIELRYAHINNFEQMLTNEGVVILKFFLHISKEEQKQRLKERLEDAEKNWKFNKQDIKERKSWSAYMNCYEEAIRRTSTPWAPWMVVPANKKWYRNLVVTECLIDHLEQLKMQYPKVDVDPKMLNFK